MSQNIFFGLGTCDSFYDKRRHINLVFMEMMSYYLYSDASFSKQISSIVGNRYKSTEQKASDICNDILSHNEHNFLNLLRERYNISEEDFTIIMSGVALEDREFKSPAGYSRENNITLLVQMIVARYYMSPQVSSAFNKINTMIIQTAAGMRGITITQQNAQSLFTLTQEAMVKYDNNFALPQIEKYVISQWK